MSMRAAAGPGGGWPPFTLAAARFTAAGLLVLGGVAVAGRPVRLSGRQFRVVAAAGVILCTGATGAATYASAAAGSAVVALAFALGPVFVALLGSAQTRTRPAALSLGGMAAGVAGVGLLLGGRAAGVPDSPAVLSALLAGPALYAAGAMLFKRAGQVDLWAATGWMLAVGAVPLWGLAAAAGEPTPAPSAAGLRAYAYLTLVSSIAGFGVYLAALRRLPTPLFLSHAWVIPLVAAGLGVGVLGETLPDRAYPAAGLIVAGLALLASGTRQSAPACPPNLPPAINNPRMTRLTSLLVRLRVALGRV